MGFSRITAALFALRGLHGVDMTANGVGGLAALSVTWTPARASTAFGWRTASHCVMGTVAPLIIAGLHWHLGGGGGRGCSLNAQLHDSPVCSRSTDEKS